MFVADVKCPQATWQTVPNSRADSAKDSISKAVVCTWHRTLVIRGRPKGSSVAFGDEMDSEMDTVHTDHVFICKQFLMHEYVCCCDVCCCMALYQQWTMKVTSSQTSCISRC